MQITLKLNDALLAQAKALAARQCISLTRLVEEGLRMRLRAQKAPGRAVSLPVYEGEGGLASGIDATKHKALSDRPIAT